MIIGSFRVGEDIAVALDAVSGDPADVTTITAKMRRSTSSTAFSPDPRSPAINLVVTPRPAAGEFPAGWNVSLAAAQSANLRPGVYGIDAKVTDADGVIDLTDQTALIRLTEAAT